MGINCAKFVYTISAVKKISFPLFLLFLKPREIFLWNLKIDFHQVTRLLIINWIQRRNPKSTVIKTLDIARHGMKINSIVNPDERLTRERYKNSSVRVDARGKNRTRG